MTTLITAAKETSTDFAANFVLSASEMSYFSRLDNMKM